MARNLRPVLPCDATCSRSATTDEFKVAAMARDCLVHSQQAAPPHRLRKRNVPAGNRLKAVGVEGGGDEEYYLVHAR